MKPLRLALLLCLVCLALCLSACGGEVDVYLQKMPDRTVYYPGDSLDWTGALLAVEAKGETALVPVTAEMQLLPEHEWVAGKNTVTLSHAGVLVTVPLYYETDIEAYRQELGRRIHRLAEDFPDAASFAVFRDSLARLETAASHAEIFAAYRTLVTWCETYPDALARAAEAEASRADYFARLEETAAYLSGYPLDARLWYASETARLQTALETVDDPERAEAWLLAFASACEEKKNDPRNSLLFALEVAFEEHYAVRRIWYTEENYGRLQTALAETQSAMRAAETAEDAALLSEFFSEETAPAVPDRPRSLAEACAALSARELVYGADADALLALHAETLSLAWDLDGIALSTDKTKVSDLLAYPEFADTKTYAALGAASPAGENFFAEVCALTDAYARLAEADAAGERVEDAIAAIGTVRLYSGTLIDTARETYDAWYASYAISPESKNSGMVANYETLLAAEARMAALPSEAKEKARRVRSLILALADQEVIYTEGSRDFGIPLREARAAYDLWVETYGDDGAAYINDGANYIARLSSYEAEYRAVCDMASELNEGVNAIRRELALLTEANYGSLAPKLDTAYEDLSVLYNKFCLANGNVTDMVSGYEALPAELAYGKFSVFAKASAQEVGERCEMILENMSTAAAFYAYKTELRTLMEGVEERLLAVYDAELSLEKNKTAQGKLRDTMLASAEELRFEYLYAFALYEAEAQVDAYAAQYTKNAAKRDALTARAVEELRAVSDELSVEDYRTALQTVLTELKRDLEQYCA